MPANTTPIFVLTPKIQFTGNITAANTAVDGTGVVNLAFTAGTFGSSLERLVFRSKGTNVQTKAYIFINNGSDPTVAANNTLFSEIGLAATTVSQTSALPQFETYFGITLQPSYRVYVTLGTAVAAGYQVTAIGGDF